MKIQFIDEDTLLLIKSNLSSWSTKFASPTSDWIKDEIGKTPFSDTKYQVDDFSLDMTADEPSSIEAKNVEILYNKLKFISDSQASDERLWAGLCLGPFWSYTQYRWKKTMNYNSASSIEQHFFFGFNSRRAVIRNAVARLWWIGRLTYDETNSDHYRLTRFVCEHADYIFHILERNTSNNPTIIRAFVSAALDARDKEQLIINTDTIGELSKYLNLLGGTYILDCLPESTIYNKILDKAREITRREQLKKEESQQKKQESTTSENEKPKEKSKNKASQKHKKHKKKKKQGKH